MMLSPGKIVLTILVVVAALAFVRFMGRGAVAKPGRAAATRSRAPEQALDLVACPTCHAYASRGSAACARADCPRRG